jgi:hypothetical protein
MVVVGINLFSLDPDNAYCSTYAQFSCACVLFPFPRADCRIRVATMQDCYVLFSTVVVEVPNASSAKEMLIVR